MTEYKDKLKRYKKKPSDRVNEICAFPVHYVIKTA